VTDWRHTTTTRLLLDITAVGDEGDLFAIHGDPDTWRHLPSGVHTDSAEAEAMVRQSERQFDEDGLGYWSVREAPRGPVVGRAGCALPTGRPWWNLYYRFATSVHGRGYATEVGARALEAAHDVAPDRPVLAFLLEHNVASRRTAEKLGMRLVWRGPDRPNPDPDAIRLVFLDRDPDEHTLRAIADHALGD
jgi:RimJ/RimL family protein N-acetyltransferase